MAKKTTSDDEGVAFEEPGVEIHEATVAEELQTSYLEYAYSVIHSRALPDARDGLKPVHRRILYTMREMGLRPDANQVKSARVVGECFVKNTLVSTPEGLVPIEDIRVGDHVLTPGGAKTRVVERYKNPPEDNMVEIFFSNGASLRTTEGQLFRVVGEVGGEAVEWCRADELAGRRVVLGVYDRKQYSQEGLSEEDALKAYVFGTTAHLSEKRVPREVLENRHAWGAYFAGLVDAEAFVDATEEKISLLALSPSYSEQIHTMLSTVGVFAKHETVIEDGRKLQAIVAEGSAAEKFALFVRFYLRIPEKLYSAIELVEKRALRKKNEEESAGEASLVVVESVVPVLEEETYDIQVEDSEHAFVAEGFVVHNCLGKFHPHGDSSVYEALVRMAQDFQLNTTLVHGHGNFGTLDAGAAAMRYCVTGDTRVRMADGTTPAISSLVSLPPNMDAPVSFEVLDKDGKGVHVSRVFNSGEQPILKVSSHAGYEISGSENHLVLCLEAPYGVPLFQWKRLDELQPGSVVAIARNAWQENSPSPLEYQMVQDYVDNIVAVNEVPDFVWDNTSSFKRAFLTTIFSNVDKNVINVGLGEEYSIGYYSESLSFLEDVQKLLLEFGVWCFLEDAGVEDNESVLIISDAKNLRLFGERVGLLGENGEKLSAILDNIDFDDNVFETVPFVKDFISSILPVEKSANSQELVVGCSIPEYWNDYRPVLLELGVDSDSVAALDSVMQSGYFFDHVRQVSKETPAEVFSLRVDSEDHSFLAGGFINHNTECKLAPMAMNMVGELGEDTVDFVPNYDGSLDEPGVLPALFPNLLVNGTSGIAVGMATNMIPHNLGEVVAACRALIKKPDLSLAQLMRYVPGPDLPTGGLLLGADQVKQAYETGRGSVRIRGKVEIAPLEGSRGRQAITFVELPYQVGAEKVIESIKTEIGKKRLNGVSDVKDLSDRKNGIRLVIECKTGVNPQALLAELYKYTPLETSFGINNLALVDGQPKTLGLKDLLMEWLDFRYETVRRRTQYRLDKAEARKHIVEGLLIALDNIDAVVKTIRASKDTSVAKAALMKKFKLSDIQTTHILEMPLRRLVSLEVLSLRKELDELLVTIEKLKEILENESVLHGVVDKELAALLKEFPIERKTELVDGELKELLAASAPKGAVEIKDEPCVLYVSTTGLLTRSSGATEEAQEARGKRGRTRHDAMLAKLNVTTRGRFLVITNKGRAYKTDVISVPALPKANGTVSARGGITGKELVGMLSDEKIITVAPLLEEYPKEAIGVALGTKQGVVKICAPDFPLRSDEFEIMGLKDGDEIIGGAWVTKPTDEFVFVTSNAQLLHYPANKVRPQGRTGGGVVGLKLPAGVEAISFNVVDPTGGEDGVEPVVVTTTGVSTKVTPLKDYPAKGRATGGVRAHKLLKDELELVAAWVGTNPRAATEVGDPVGLPDKMGKRDGSGMMSDAFKQIGSGASR